MTDNRIALYFVQHVDEEGTNRDLHVLAHDPAMAYQLWLEYYADETEDNPIGAFLEQNPMTGLLIGFPSPQLPEEPCLIIRQFAFDLSQPHAIGWQVANPEFVPVAYALAGTDKFWATNAVESAIAPLDQEAQQE